MSSMTDNKPVDDGGAAFPEAIAVSPAGDVYFGPSGMSKRDYFAGQALAGICAAPSMREIWSPEDVAQQAYNYADAMLAARQEQPR